MNKISKSIKKYRTALNLSQSDLADKLFVSRQTISSWENGRTQPDLEMIEKLSQALSVTTEELIYGEKPKLVDDGNNEKSKKIMITIIAVLASLLVGVGGILIFVNYWEMFGETFKVILSILPLVIGQAFAVFVFLKKRESVSWREGVAILWTVGVISSVALLNSICNLALGFANCIIIDALLILPIIYVLEAVSPLIVYFGLSLTYCIYLVDNFDYIYNSVEYDMPIIIIYLIMVALVALGCLYVYLHRESVDDSRHMYSVWLSLIAILVSTVIISSLYYYMFALVVSVALLLYVIQDKWHLLKPVNILSPFVIAFCSIWTALIDMDYYTYGWSVKNIIVDFHNSYFNFKFDEIFIVVIAGGIAIFSIIKLIMNYSNDVARIIYIVSVGLVFIMNFTTEFVVVNNLGFLIQLIIVIVEGITLAIIGAKEYKFFKLNVGMITVAAMVIAIIEWQDMDTFITGIILLVLGISLFVVNYKLSKSNKKESVEVIENE